jgi:hypothetical protein
MGRLALTVILAVPLLASAQTLAVKTGAWETTTKSASLPRPMVDKECVTKVDLAEFAKGPDKEDDDECKFLKSPTLAGNKWSADKKCADGRTVHAEFVAETPEKVVGTIVSSAPKGGSAIRVEVSARWIGASCAGIK